MKRVREVDMAKDEKSKKLDGLMRQMAGAAHIKVYVEKGLAQFDESGIPNCGDPDCHLCANLDWSKLSS